MDQQLKTRVIGAVAVVALAVAFVPMLFDKQAPKEYAAKTDIPLPPDMAVDNLVPTTSQLDRIAWVDDPTSKHVQAEPKLIPELKSLESNSLESSKSDRQRLASKATAKVREAQKENAAKQYQNHPKLAQKIAKLDLDKVSNKRYNKKTNIIIKVPTPATNHNTKSHQTKTNFPEKVLAGWTVQIGAFSQKANAIKLQDKLRQKGYNAYIKNVKRNNKPLTFVYVGPELKRSKADTLAINLQNNMRLKGLVLPYRPARG